MIYTGTCASDLNTCEEIEQDIVDIEDFFIKQNINIEPNEEHSYEMEIEFIETGENQDYNNQASLSGKISVYETGSYQLEQEIQISAVGCKVFLLMRRGICMDGDTILQTRNYLQNRNSN